MSDLESIVTGLDFGEGPRWRDGHLWWSDFHHHTVSRVVPGSTPEVVLRLDGDGQPSGLGWLPDGSLLVVSMLDRRVLRYDGAAVSTHADLASIATFHCNDMLVDDTGVAYVGNFGWDIAAEGYAGRRGATLALVRPDGTVEAAAGDLQFPNGMALTDGGSTLLVGESVGQQIRAYTRDETGRLSNERIWARVGPSAPDGCAIDREGGLWIADAANQRVQRVVEGGEITDEIATGVGTFACALGGDDGTTLFILTAATADPAKLPGSATGQIVATTVAIPA